MSEFQVSHIEYEYEDIEAMVYDSVVDGYCSECDDVTTQCEPDATENWCPCCENGSVKSVLIILGLC